jgi:hypothetical protein
MSDPSRSREREQVRDRVLEEDRHAISRRPALTTQANTQLQGPEPWMKAEGSEHVLAARGLWPERDWQGYGGERVADLGADWDAARDLITQLLGRDGRTWAFVALDAGVDCGTSRRRTTRTKTVEDYMNPYVDGVLGGTLRRILASTFDARLSSPTEPRRDDGWRLRRQRARHPVGSEDYKQSRRPGFGDASYRRPLRRLRQGPGATEHGPGPAHGDAGHVPRTSISRRVQSQHRARALPERIRRGRTRRVTRRRTTSATPTSSSSAATRRTTSTP